MGLTETGCEAVDCSRRGFNRGPFFNTTIDIGLPKSTRAEDMGFVVNKVALEQIMFQPIVVVYLPSGAQFFPTAVAGDVLTRAMAHLLSCNKDM